MNRQKSGEIVFTPIGVIRSDFKNLEDMPIQPSGKTSSAGIVEVYPRYRDGLKDLDGFSHVILIYHFHLAGKSALIIKPFLDEKKRGVFATTAPVRPNPLGISTVRVSRIENGRIYVENIDVLDQTPLLDIKPYVPEFDQADNVNIGWLEGARGRIRDRKSDGRFG